MYNSFVPHPSDADLLRRSLEGDRAAYASLFHRHASRVGRLAYLLLHDWDSAEDVVQETFLRGLVRLDTFRFDSSPRSWFVAIALNLVRNLKRAGRLKPASTDPAALDGFGPPRRGVVTSVLRRETSGQLAVALGYLTPAQREVFVLHYIEGLPYDDIAPLQKISAAAARQSAHRARDILKERIPGHISSSKVS
jgi:RNA polymerase sigma-70 factor (ECF subfamily)